MSSWSTKALGLLVFLFIGASSLYAALWMYSVRREPAVALGIEFSHSRSEAAIRVLDVLPGSAAALAGLQSGDRIRSIDGRDLRTTRPLEDLIFGRAAGETILLVVERPGQAAALRLAVELGPPLRELVPLPRRLMDELLNSYPVLFLVVAAGVLLVRPADPHAWRLALLFAAFIASAPYFEAQTPAAFRPYCLAFKVAFDGLSPGLFLYFFATFPDASPLDRRLPWLKSLWLGAGLPVVLPLAATALATGSLDAFQAWAGSLGSPLRALLLGYYFGGFSLGLASLGLNALHGAPAVRRKGRVIVWGTLAGMGPALLLFAAGAYLQKAPYEFPFWVWASCVLALLLIPLSFAYAVVRHRVLEVPVLLRRSARYLLVQRGFVGLLVVLGAGAVAFFALSFPRSAGHSAGPLAIGMGAGFGTLLVWTGSRIQRRVRERIDRAFFRSAYDARHILQDLTARARGATSREKLAELLEQHLRDALLPSSLAIYFEARPSELDLVRGVSPGAPQGLPGRLAVLGELARRGEPLELDGRQPVHREALTWLEALAPDCLVPILGRTGRLIGVLVLGARLSEEPYSGEDKRLLASVASQAGIALDSIQLAEQMAERLEAERRAAHEIELARQVQSKLLPQRPLELATVECAGSCVQARAVGGDYFDFIDLGARRLGIVLADVSGKGFSAALLMASLQASLRSRLVPEPLELPQSLQAVNQLLYRSSDTNRFATLFLGLYDDARRQLSYVNCGHNPPLLLRADGAIERLLPTAPAVGLFEDWECAIGEVSLAGGDLLALFSDGITEAWSDAGTEFGEARLIEALARGRALPVSELVEAVLAAVQRFSGNEQDDDQTLVVARVR